MEQTFFSQLLATLKTFTFKDFIDVAIIALLLFYLLRLFRQSRVGQLIKGFLILLAVYGVSYLFELTMLKYILNSIFTYWAIIFIVVFQPELRLGLERLGRSNKRLRSFVSSTVQNPEDQIYRALSDVADTCAVFSKSKTGALIVFERETPLGEIADTGTVLNSDVSPALLGNIFFNKAPLHDGACIIREGKIHAAGCILPLSDNLNISQDLGTRHRAAIGMSEASDAVVVVVSEETGSISVALNGILTRDFKRDDLYNRLVELIIVGDNNNASGMFATLFNKRKEKKNEKE
ncbi:diadenylate cyclase CdaA [Ruminococcus difficilis]|uniref:Diadenylate cyclase n=1 Tax=Ruminococcus difficilis TaxID=2763069 RepID=A0A934TZP2_9FIRM|nr:diadenylate cyclase CdaA [Ruminococcus difficilis]MBK6087838.1 TIGR00159 family protein [Ruminococcus difficilis]